ncbi:MAG: glycine--tRNA ligase subunit beta [Candidatus Omnitrophica bacterium]|nr:glycine--tRNA ligase subunit beta [Candidatus Omnitrophota bacterium]
MRTKAPSLLFEIGVEEVPSPYFAQAEASISAKAPMLLAECGYQFDELEVFSTPRRFVIHARNFRSLAFQADEKSGPLKEQCYVDGQPTPALLGFLKGVKKKESDIYFKEGPRGPRVCVKVKKERKPLRYFFETLPAQIEFPKLMRWESSRYAFTRPIRWTFAFVGSKMQKYKMADVQSSNFTWGHRFLSPKRMKVLNSDLEAFEQLLFKHGVILKLEARINKIKSFLKGFHNDNEELIQTVAHLVENPFPVSGTFEKGYLKLPAAILTTCMSKNQKIFACYDSSGRLENRFLAVLNGPRKKVREIAQNYGSVLRSRLEDAQFFFHEDQKTKLASKVEKLKEMIFLGSLGSYWDKTKRLEAMVSFLGRESHLSPDTIRDATRAAYLAKADLVTHLVYEFPELQGTTGYEYARIEGEKMQVARAVVGHYFPTNLSQNFHELKKRLNVEGALVGLADRMDLLVGASSLGIELSGSQDPYGLRRAAGGMVKILRAHPLRISLSGLIRASCQEYGTLISKRVQEIEKQLIPFFKERIVFELQVKPGSKEFEVLQGIFASGFDDISNVYERFDHLSKELSERSFLRACKVMERTGNILKGVKEKINERVEPSLFEDSLERTLFDLLNKEESIIKGLIKERRYGTAVKRYGDVFYQPIHDFFDRVLVNAEDPKMRNNRQALVKKINSLCSAEVADLSYVTNV